MSLPMSATADVLVIGAGPYGLSTYAHLRRLGVRARILGEPMRTWQAHMPAGMFLKSTPAASTIAAGRPGFGLDDYCRLIGVPPLAESEQVPAKLFVAYGKWFTAQLAPEVERTEVTEVRHVGGAFQVRTSDGEEFGVRSVVVASGLIGHAHVPPELAPLTSDHDPADAPVSHSSQHEDLTVFAGRDVAVVGAGQSALETAALLAEASARPTVLVRGSQVQFGGTPCATAPTGARRLTAKPDSPLGPGWSLLAFTKGPAAFRYLPDPARLDLVGRILGPSGAWWLRERVVDRFPIRTGQTVRGASVDGDRVALDLAGPDGDADGEGQTVHVDHVISATGYRIGPDAFAFLSPELRHAVTRVHNWPRLRPGYESSVPGLYFVGFPSAATFGPLMRFVCGTAYAGPRVARAVLARTRS